MKRFSVLLKLRSLRVFSAKNVLFLVSCVFFLLFFGCKKDNSPDALDKDTSYAFGMLMASQLGGSMGFYDLRFDYDAFKEGFRDFNEARETRLSQEKAIEKINAAITNLQSKQDEERWIEGEKQRQEGENYLSDNKVRAGVTTTPSGLQYEVLVMGSGGKPGPTDTVQVHYEGTLIDGTVFDSSYARGIPAEFPLDAVISGWTEGLQLMNEGSTFRFVIPSDLAYGSGGAGSIPPGATLIFKVELLSILK